MKLVDMLSTHLKNCRQMSTFVDKCAYSIDRICCTKDVSYVKALESGLFMEKDYVENAEYISERHKTKETLSKSV